MSEQIYQRPPASARSRGGSDGRSGRNFACGARPLLGESVASGLAHAAFVVEGGAAVLESAIADGRVPTNVVLRTGFALVRPFDLRAAGLLVEVDAPHRLAFGSARNVLRELTLVFQRANTAGAGMVGEFWCSSCGRAPPTRCAHQHHRTGGCAVDL